MHFHKLLKIHKKINRVSLVPLSKHFESARNMCGLDKSYIRIMTIYGHMSSCSHVEDTGTIILSPLSSVR